MTELTLRTGKVVPAAIAGTVSLALMKLLEQHPVALYELHAACLDPAHVMFGGTGRAALETGLLTELLPDGRAVIHSLTRDVVLASLDGSGPDITLRSPVAEARS